MDTKKHILQSEITNADGSFNKKAAPVANDIPEAIAKILHKHKGKLFLDALEALIHAAVNHDVAFCRALSS